MDTVHGTSSAQADDPLGASPIDCLIGNLGWLRGWLGARLSGCERQEVDDLCQEVILRALRAAETLRDPQRLAPWVYRIAQNVLKDFQRQRARRRRRMLPLDGDCEDERSHSRDLEERDELGRLLGLVLSLPSRYREPLLLRHVEDLPYAQIARILGLRESTVQVRIFRARQALRRLLESRAAAPARARLTSAALPARAVAQSALDALRIER